MAKLVRRHGKLLRKGGRLVRSDIDLDPNAPCECCEELPPDPGSWFCDARTGECEPRLQAGGFATEADCQANCEPAANTWNCEGGICVGVVGNGGDYLTLEECEADCDLNPFE